MARTLKEWRARKDMTQKEFADLIGVSPSTYNIWENNPNAIKIGNVIRISNVLGVSPQDIIFFGDDSYLKYDNREEVM